MARRRAALGVARQINTAEATYAAGHGGAYADGRTLSSAMQVPYDLTGAEVASGFALMLDAGEKGYWFEIVDTTDACGFRFISNQRGVIFEAQPIQ